METKTATSFLLYLLHAISVKQNLLTPNRNQQAETSYPKKSVETSQQQKDYAPNNIANKVSPKALPSLKSRIEKFQALYNAAKNCR